MDSLHDRLAIYVTHSKFEFKWHSFFF